MHDVVCLVIKKISFGLFHDQGFGFRVFGFESIAHFMQWYTFWPSAVMGFLIMNCIWIFLFSTILPPFLESSDCRFSPSLLLIAFFFFFLIESRIYWLCREGTEPRLWQVQGLSFVLGASIRDTFDFIVICHEPLFSHRVFKLILLKLSKAHFLKMWILW